MATYVNDLRLKEIGTGESSGTWGTETNVNLELIGEALSFGTESITTNADTHTSTVADGSTDPARSMYIKYTGTLDSACTITIAPNTLSRLHFIENGTSGSQNIIISQGSGANVTIPPGDVKVVYLDGAGSGAAVVDAFASLNVVDLKVEDDLTVTDDATIGGTLGVTGVLTANAGVVVDNITIDGTEIDLSSGTLTIDVASNIELDADGGQVIFMDGGTNIGRLENSSSDFVIKSMVDDKDIIFKGEDGGSGITALTLDMSAAGAATFNAGATFGGNVGIGGSSAFSTLEVIGDKTESNNLQLTLKGATNTNKQMIMGFDTTADTAHVTTQIAGSSPTPLIFKTGNVVFNEDSNDADFRVESNSLTHALFVDAGSDTVVIGGTVAETADHLEVLSSDSTTNVRVRNTNAGASGPLLVFDKASSSPANDDVCGEIRFIGKDSAGNAEQYAGLKVESGNVTSGGEDGITTFGMAVNGSYQNIFNINHVGTTFNEGGIGALDFRAESTSAAHMLYVNAGDNTVTFDNSDFSTIDGASATGVAIRTAGRMVFCGTDGGNIMEFNINGTGGVGTIRVSGSATSYNTSSDERLKENISDAEDAGELIDAIQVRQFDWKTDGEHQRYGMVAQELNTVTPEAVSVPDDPEKMQSVDYSKLVPMLVKEIQTLRSRVAQLEK
tara:strand:+ start:1711 stop:3729 length:2019 start_codon:yes stop_codon:yes gene_type:complete